MGVHVSPILNTPPSPSPSHPSGSSQCTSPERPVSCIEPGLEICFTYAHFNAILSSHLCLDFKWEDPEFFMLYPTHLLYHQWLQEARFSHVIFHRIVLFHELSWKSMVLASTEELDFADFDCKIIFCGLNLMEYERPWDSQVFLLLFLPEKPSQTKSPVICAHSYSNVVLLNLSQRNPSFELLFQEWWDVAVAFWT